MNRIAGLVLVAAVQALGAPPDASSDGKALFQQNCAICHKASGENRTPTPDALMRLSKKAVVDALTTGSMKTQGAALSVVQREAIAEYLTAGNVAPTGVAKDNACPDSTVTVTSAKGWNGWGVDAANTRFQPAGVAGLTDADIPNLKLKWAFGIPNTGVMFGQPSIADGNLFFGTNDGTIYALDGRTGCVHWKISTPYTVRSAISFGKIGAASAAFFGDVKANVYAIDTATGKQLWETKVDDHPVARVTGAPKLYQGRLYVPVSSIEEVSAGNPKYECCKFRGSVVALDAATGKQIWKTYSIPDAPSATGQSAAGTNSYGPAGAAIWSSPTIDEKRKVLYVGTGNQYADPPSKYSDAILAMDLETGSMKWSKQLTEGDHWNFACVNPTMKGSCPPTLGPDVDIGSSPILKTVGGKDVLVVGQKSGVVHALDPDHRGEILWQVRVGKGGALGGIMWGSAADDRNVYVPLSDWSGASLETASTSGGGLFALRLSDGEKAWYAPPVKPACTGTRGCSPSQMAPATAIPGVVFSGSMDGHLRAYSVADGKVIWDFDTLREFDTVNGVKAKGGSLNASGPTIAAGMLFVNSGYGALGGMSGNVLLAFGK